MKPGFLKKKLAPKRYFHEMAGYGLLDDMLEGHLKTEFENEEEFRNDMLNTLYHYSKGPSKILERFYLEKMVESLSYFVEYTKTCQKPKL